MEEKQKIFYERLGLGSDFSSLARRKRDVLLDRKWKIFLGYAKLFRHIPFVDIAFAAGSMAFGNVHPSSDFDVLVGARTGRIFTARAFCILVFGMLGIRKRKLTHHDDAADKICLNHFITERSLRLRPPHDLYWQELYRNLVPIYGEKARIAAFWAANDWIRGVPRALHGDMRHKSSGSSLLKKCAEVILSGGVGDGVEAFLGRIQRKRIERNVRTGLSGYAPRVHYSHDELEFHPDTFRISRFIDGL